MAKSAIPDAHGVLTEPATLKIERVLPGPIERIWAYLTESDMRKKWFASGEMRLEPGASFELVWRNDDLSDVAGQRPPGFPEEHHKTCRIVEVDAPRKLVFIFAEHGEVTFSLEPMGKQVLLTLIHRRIPDRSTTLGVSAGWHAHLDVLVARASGTSPESFWDNWSRLKKEYEQRWPA